MPRWLLIALFTLALLPLWHVYDGWIYRKFYVEGRTPMQQERTNRFRAWAIVFFAIAALVAFAGKIFPTVALLPYVEGALLAPAFYFIVRATQRVSGVRTIAALLLVLAGGAVIVAGIGFDIIPRAANNHATFTVASAGVILLAIGMFVLAVRLARPN